MQLYEKTCLVTGSGRGIGHGIVERFCQEGAVVYANARKEGSLDEWAYEVAEQGKGSLHPVYFDVTDTDAVKRCIMGIKKERGGLDVVVNNAGVMRDAPIGMVSQAMMEESFATNVYAVINLIQYACKLMTRQKSGSIINMASIMGVAGNKNQLVYSATKGAVVSLTKSAAKELAPSNVRVNAIAPGVIDTDLFRQISEEKAEQFASSIGLGRFGTPRDVADLCVFLASDASAYITGQVIGIDGSMVV